MIVDCAVYEDGRRRDGAVDLAELRSLRPPAGAFVWIGLHEPTPEEFDAVNRELGLHELAVEDAIKAHQRPKLEVYGESLFVVLKTARYIDETETVEFGEILCFVGDGFIVVVRHGEASALRDVRRAMEARPDLLGCGPGAVLHGIIDRVVDDYAPVIAGLENDISEVELAVFSAAAANPVERIYKLKREVLELHSATAPLVDPLDSLAGGRHPAVHEDVRHYFRDVHDHVLRVVDRTGQFSDLLTSILSANLTRVSVRQNDDMRKISAWVAIAAVPTMVAGIYGMNFRHMPELGWRYGYPLVLAVVAVACLLLYRGFRRSGWL